MIKKTNKITRKRLVEDYLWEQNEMLIKKAHGFNGKQHKINNT